MEGTSNSAVNNQNGCGGLHPSVLFLLGTLGLTSCATAMLCAAIMTDHWETVSWNQTKVREINERHLISKNLSSDLMIEASNYLDGHVTRIAIKKVVFPFYSDTDFNVVAAVFLVPMHGGIWTLCVTLEEDQARLLTAVGYNHTELCVNYLPPLFQRTDETEQRPDWQHRMQNLSISCALVCLIILGSSALVGAFGVLKHQISAVLVTGVMYLLAATFALFTLTIIHFKRQQTKSRGAPTKPPTECLEPLGTYVDGVSPNNRTALDPAYTPIWADYYPARTYAVGWSLDLGWGGVTLCVLASVLWILLSKIMRYNPISTTLLA